VKELYTIYIRTQDGLRIYEAQQAAIKAINNLIELVPNSTWSNIINCIVPNFHEGVATAPLLNYDKI
jgi:hypothetical protein